MKDRVYVYDPATPAGPSYWTTDRDDEATAYVRADLYDAVVAARDKAVAVVAEVTPAGVPLKRYVLELERARDRATERALEVAGSIPTFQKEIDALRKQLDDDTRSVVIASLQREIEQLRHDNDAIRAASRQAQAKRADAEAEAKRLRAELTSMQVGRDGASR